MASELNQDEIINDAGRMLYYMHPWRFRDRPPSYVDFNSGVEFAPIPSDFAELVGYQMVDGLNFGMTFTTPQVLLLRRSSNVTVTQNYYWVTLVRPRHINRKQRAPGPRMEIWPTPSADVKPAVQLWYRAKWPDLVDADDVATVPEYCESLLIEMVRAFVQGWNERLLEPLGGIQEILRRVKDGPIYEAARDADGLEQSDYGHLTGGAIQLHWPLFSWRSASASAVADPA